MQKQAYLPTGVTYPFTVNIKYFGHAELIPTEWLDERTKRVFVNGSWSDPIVYPLPGRPDDLTNPYFNDESTPFGYLAVTGSGNDENEYPRLIDEYFTDEIRAEASHIDAFGLYGFVDIVHLIQHEFGHAILGAHDSDSKINTKKYIEPLDQNIMSEDNVIAKLNANPTPKIEDITSSTTFSCLCLWGNESFSSLGLWNMRGIFDRDADRLASGSTDLSWTGYPLVSYPIIHGKIELSKSTGEKFYTDNWHTAQNMMEWPENGNLAAHDTQWFLTDIILPSIGDKYVSVSTDNGWTVNRIYTYNGSSWDETIPDTGDVVKINSTYYRYNGSSWGEL